MFCMDCGAELLIATKYCGNCGTKVPDKNAAVPQHSQCMESSMELNLSTSAKESLAHLKKKYKYAGLKERKGCSKERKGCSTKSKMDGTKEIIIHIMDLKKKALKRLFPSEDGLTGCITITSTYEETVREWLEKLSTHFTGHIDFKAYIMGSEGLQALEMHWTLEEVECQKPKKRPLKVYAMAKGKERKEIMQKFKRQKTSEGTGIDEDLRKISFKSGTGIDEDLPEISFKSFSDDDLDLELPDIPKSSPRTESKTKDIQECSDDVQILGPSPFKPDLNSHLSNVKDFSRKEATTSNRFEDVQINFKTSTPKKSTAATNDYEVQILEPTTSKCSDFKHKQSHLSPENEIIDQEIEKFFDVMEMKIKRKKMADDTSISFPSKEDGKVVTLIYADHGGMSLTRPFCRGDSLQSIFTYICQEVEAEILPPAFHLECPSPLSCQCIHCKHCYELEVNHSVAISSLPDVLVIKEGNYLMDDTITNFGNVLM